MADPAAVKRGEALFEGSCSDFCHNRVLVDTQSEIDSLTPMEADAAFLFDCEWKHGDRDEDIFRVIQEGVAETRMPSFAGKMPEGDEDIWKLVAYLRTKSTCG